MNQLAGKPKGRKARAGFTLVDVTVAMFILLVAIGGLFGAIISSLQLSDSTDETAIADEALTQLIERMDLTDFDDLFATFNGDSTDDPLGIGTAPGPNFDVDGLRPRKTDADGMVGQIIFPVPGGTPGILRENFDYAKLGMPRDLNGDGLQDPLDHADDYIVLPLTIRLEWVGIGGPQLMERSLLLMP